MALDDMKRYWVMLFVGEKSGPESFGRAVQWLVTFFYADYGILALPRLDRLQE